MKKENEHQLIHCDHCGKNFDPFKKLGFLQFLSLILLANTAVFLAIMVIEILWLVMDGTQWEVGFWTDEFRLKSHGSNAFPGNFESFIWKLTVLTGGKMF